MGIGCFRLIKWRRWLFITEREHIVLGVRRSDWCPWLVWSSGIEKGRFCCDALTKILASLQRRLWRLFLEEVYC
jgi:hypothetical protein